VLRRNADGQNNVIDKVIYNLKTVMIFLL